MKLWLEMDYYQHYCHCNDKKINIKKEQKFCKSETNNFRYILILRLC